MENSLHPARADKHQAFQRWKRSCHVSAEDRKEDNTKVKEDVKTKDELARLCARNSDRLNYLLSVQMKASEFEE